MLAPIAPLLPAECPELAQLVWNRDPSRPIPPEETFALYERNWRCFDASVACRDAFGLGFLTLSLGEEIPPRAREKAEGTFGGDIRRKLVAVLRLLADPAPRAAAAAAAKAWPDGDGAAGDG